MAGDINKKIEKLKDMAIGRCRERIELAACKAKELLNRPESREQKEGMTNSAESHGMTSYLKRRHGL